MSHLLYLHSFDVQRFVNVFGRGGKADIDKLMKVVSSTDMTWTTPATAKKVITTAVTKGLDGKPLPKAEQAVLDYVVYEALSSRTVGIPTTPISRMGAGGPLFDEFRQQFEDVGAAKLFEVLQRGRDYEFALILLSPADVTLAAEQLQKAVDAVWKKGDVDMVAIFKQELVEPFAAAAKKGRAIFGSWG